MMRIIDGDVRSPPQIAAELGMVGKFTGDAELLKSVEKAVNGNMDVVKKILRTGKQGPVMHLVGIIMRQTQNKADPVIIKHLIEEQVKKVKIDPKDLGKSDDDEK